jgi:hypothetical protein
MTYYLLPVKLRLEEFSRSEVQSTRTDAVVLAGENNITKFNIQQQDQRYVLP